MKHHIVAIIYTIVITIAVMEIVVLGYLSNFHLFAWAGITLGTAYGMVVFVHFLMQMVFATQNRFYIQSLRKKARAKNYHPVVDIIATGYKEHPQLLREHFCSITKLKDPFRRYWFMSDGVSRDDHYEMLQVFKEVFPEGAILEFPFVLKNVKGRRQKRYWKQLVQLISPKVKYIFLAQPHEDKRRAMYTTVKTIFFLGKPDLIITTDSDTRFKKTVVREMSAPFIEKQVGAVTGDVQILNNTKRKGGSWLSFLSSLRYWQAFNLERAAQSFFGTVTCVSGPLGAYRSVVLQEILEDWANQQLFGRKTTTGEDRCLTNYTLRSKGKRRGEAWRVHFTPYASCETETPIHLWRWIKQQERWSRSFYREAMINYRWAHKHHTWLTYELTYHMFFPFLLMASVCAQIHLYLLTHEIRGIVFLFSTILLSGLLHSFYAMYYTKQKRHLFLSFYGFLYMAFLLWAKIFALLFVWRTGWGTSVRSEVLYLPNSSKATTI
jgi:hyaluronan synthase